jgi:hypothetical protein
LEFDYQIEYKKGRENVVTVALSRKDPQLSAITSTTPAWVSDIEASHDNDPHYTALIQKYWLTLKQSPTILFIQEF